MGHFESHWGYWQWWNTLEDRDTGFRSEYLIVIYRTELERKGASSRFTFEKSSNLNGPETPSSIAT